MLTRIYGTAWESKEQLKVGKGASRHSPRGRRRGRVSDSLSHCRLSPQEYQRVLEEAKKRDHRTVGKRLDLFSIQEVRRPCLRVLSPGLAC